MLLCLIKGAESCWLRVGAYFSIPGGKNAWIHKYKSTQNGRLWSWISDIKYPALTSGYLGFPLDTQLPVRLGFSSKAAGARQVSHKDHVRPKSCLNGHTACGILTGSYSGCSTGTLAALCAWCSSGGLHWSLPALAFAGVKFQFCRELYEIALHQINQYFYFFSINVPILWVRWETELYEPDTATQVYLCKEYQ